MVHPQITYLGPAHPERPSKIGTPTRELDSRTSDGIHVCLLWHPHDARVSVAVHDTKTGDAFQLPVPDGSRALDVFHHPYAYADGRAPALPTGVSGAHGISFTAHGIGRTHDRAS
ncbi:MAG: hypothetical protein WAN22_02275 [Solirubrobacteraceae bacterium]